MMRRTMLTIQVETEKRDKQTLLGSDKSGVRKRVSDKVCVLLSLAIDFISCHLARFHAAG